jgi:spermidine/putrescine transport system substrate-binding protein
MMSPEIQARLPKELGYAPANGKALEMVDADTRKAMDIDTLVTNIPKIQFQYNLGADFDNRAIQIWEKAKSMVAK